MCSQEGASSGSSPREARTKVTETIFSRKVFTFSYGTISELECSTNQRAAGCSNAHMLVSEDTQKSNGGRSLGAARLNCEFSMLSEV